MGRGIISSPISKEEVVESFIRSSGPGGQNVNKTSTCVQLLHIPTGLSVKCQESRRQDINRKRAWEILQEKLDQLIRDKQAAKQAAIAKIRRQNRKRSVSAKERVLAQKRHRSQIKSVRAKGAYDKE